MDFLFHWTNNFVSQKKIEKDLQQVPAYNWKRPKWKADIWKGHIFLLTNKF